MACISNRTFRYQSCSDDDCFSARLCGICGRNAWKARDLRRRRTAAAAVAAASSTVVPSCATEMREASGVAAHAPVEVFSVITSASQTKLPPTNVGEEQLTAPTSNLTSAVPLFLGVLNAVSSCRIPASDKHVRDIEIADLAVGALCIGCALCLCSLASTLAALDLGEHLPLLPILLQQLRRARSLRWSRLPWGIDPAMGKRGKATLSSWLGTRTIVRNTDGKHVALAMR